MFIEHFGWRGACVAWAVLHLAIGLPMNRLLIPKAVPHPPEKAAEHGTASPGIPWTMIVLASVFGATWCVSTALAAHLPRLLEAMGATTAMAIFAGSLLGPAQVAARLVEFTFLRKTSPMISARLATALHPLGAVLLAIFGPVMAVPFVLLHGAGNGMLTIARGTLPLALSARLATACVPASSRRRHASFKAARRCYSASCSIAGDRTWPSCAPARSPAFPSLRSSR